MVDSDAGRLRPASHIGDEMTVKTYRVEGTITTKGDPCKCEWCQGHNKYWDVNETVEARDEDEAIEVAESKLTIPDDGDWTDGPNVVDVELERLERVYLEAWVTGQAYKAKSDETPLTLAIARGEVHVSTAG